MDLPNPIPATWVALWLLVPGVLLFGRWLAGRATDDDALATVAAPGCAVASLVGVSHLLSYALGSFHLGWMLAMLVLGGAGLGLSRSRGSKLRWSLALREWRAPLIGLALSLLIVAPLAFGWAFHDEVQLYSHMSTVGQLQNDVYPPRYPTFPAWELRYHYGFNVLAAALTGMLRVPSNVAIDLVTLAGWSYAWVVLAALGRRVANHAAGWLSAPLALLGGGYSALCTATPPDCPSCARVAACGVGDELINGPFLSYLFQHPWGLGLPIGATALLLATDRETAPRPSRYAALAMVLFGLTFSQFAIYLAVAATLVFAAAVEGGADRWRRPGLTVAALAAGFALASQLGGFFAPTPGDGALIAWSPGITGAGVAGELRWFGGTFGLLLPLGLAGVALAPQHRWTLAPLALGGLPLVLLLTWGGVKWDVFKFATLSQVFLGVAAGVVVARLWANGPATARTAARGGAVALTLATVWGGVSFALPFLELTATGEQDAPLETRFARVHPTVDGPDAEAIAWLRAHVQAGEIVYRADFAASFAYQVWGGLSVPWTEHRAAMFGFDDARMRQREALFDVRPDRFEALRDEGIVWFVVSPSDPPGLQMAMQQWTGDGRAAVVTRFGELTVVRLRPPFDSPAARSR